MTEKQSAVAHIRWGHCYASTSRFYARKQELL